MKSSIQIQKGISRDQLPKVVALFDEVFEKKMSLAIPDVEARRQFFAEIFSAQACIAALRDGDVVGAAGFQNAAEAFSGGLTGRGVPWETIRRHFGFFDAIRASFFFGLYTREVSDCTLLMDGIFVDEQARGQGVGRMLLESIIAYAAEQGYKKVQLGVIDTNPRAKALYEKVGFVSAGRKSVACLRWLLGFSGYYVMVYSVAGTPVTSESSA